MTIDDLQRTRLRLDAYSKRDEEIRRTRPEGWALDDPRLQPRLEQARREADAEYERLIGPVEPAEGAKMKSWKKLLAVAVGGAIVAVGKNLGWDDNTVQWLVTLVTGYIVGQGIADAGKSRALLGK